MPNVYASNNSLRDYNFLGNHETLAECSCGDVSALNHNA